MRRLDCVRGRLLIQVWHDFIRGGRQGARPTDWQYVSEACFGRQLQFRRLQRREERAADCVSESRAIVLSRSLLAHLKRTNAADSERITSFHKPSARFTPIVHCGTVLANDPRLDGWE